MYIKHYKHSKFVIILTIFCYSEKNRSTGGSTPQGGSLSYSRNPNSIPESLPAIPSVGSPGSAGPSPHPNSSLSQPTSVPPPDQVSIILINFILSQQINRKKINLFLQLIPVISPIPPPSNIQPSTPNEHLDKNTPAATPTDQQDSKSTTTSPYVAPAPLSVEPPPTNNANNSNSNNGNNATDQVKVKTEPNNQSNANATANVNNSDGASVSGNSSANANSGNATMNSDLKNILSLMKRPILSSRDYENIIDDDYMPHQLLYDYSTWDAW